MTNQSPLPSAILQTAKDLISDPAKWNKGEYAINKKSCKYPLISSLWDVTEENINDFCFCAQGALIAARKTKDKQMTFVIQLFREKENTYLRTAIESIDNECDSIESFNDKPSTSHEDIMRVFDMAIQFAKIDESKE